jgi:mannose-6-phosphate isomerase-like protein (cupin superfamily)
VQLAVVVSGCLKLELEGETLLLEPGREVEIPFGAWHRASNPHKTPCEWIYGYDR